jgi:hypothetical protein
VRKKDAEKASFLFLLCICGGSVALWHIYDGIGNH